MSVSRSPPSSARSSVSPAAGAPPCSSLVCSWSEGSPGREEYVHEALAHLARYWEDVEITRDGDPVEYRVKIDSDSDYPIVFLWESEIPAGTMVRDRIAYPTFRDAAAKAGWTDPSYVVDYIVHTGAGWAAPIRSARIEACVAEVRFYLKTHARVKISRELECETRRVRIQPTPTSFDRERGCAIWERERWVPDEDDDIEIWDERTREDACGPVPGSNPHFDYVREEMAYWVWCGDDQLARMTGIAERRLDDETLERIVERAIRRVRSDREPVDWNNFWSAFHELQVIEDRLLIYRYLRNYYFALRGHEFDDWHLARCFAEVELDRSAGSSELAKANIRFLLERELRLKERRRRVRRETEFPIRRTAASVLFEWRPKHESDAGHAADAGSASDVGHEADAALRDATDLGTEPIRERGCDAPTGLWETLTVLTIGVFLVWLFFAATSTRRRSR